MSNTNPLATLWIGKGTIYEYQNVTDPNTYQTSQKLVPIITDEPCRVSYTHKTISSITDNAGGVPITVQVITLFIKPDLEIKPGSIIEVTQHGRTVKYKGSSTPSVYSNHQEVKLELYEEHA